MILGEVSKTNNIPLQQSLFFNQQQHTLCTLSAQPHCYMLSSEQNNISVHTVTPLYVIIRATQYICTYITSPAASEQQQSISLHSHSINQARPQQSKLIHDNLSADILCIFLQYTASEAKQSN